MKEFPSFEVDGLEPAAICCSWLPTDNHMFVVGYENSHLAFFDMNKGQICQNLQIIEGSKSSITSIAAHEFQPIVVTGQEGGEIVVYDYKQSKIVEKKLLEPDQTAERIQTITFTNNCLNLLVGYATGEIKLYDFKTLKLLSVVQKAHLQKDQDGVNCIITTKVAGTDKSDRSNTSASILHQWWI